MDRLIYDAATSTIIERIKDCEGTVTGTPYDIFEGTPEEVDAECVRLGLTAPE